MAKYRIKVELEPPLVLQPVELAEKLEHRKVSKKDACVWSARGRADGHWEEPRRGHGEAVHVRSPFVMSMVLVSNVCVARIGK